MPFLDASAIKLGPNTKFGELLNTLLERIESKYKFSPDKKHGLVSPEYAHISISIMDGQHSEEQKTIYNQIVAEAAEKIANLQTITTSEFSPPSEQGYYNLKVDSPELKKIMSDMYAKFDMHSIKYHQKTPHICIHKGIFDDVNKQNTAKQNADMLNESRVFKPLENQTFSLKDATYGHVKFQGDNAIPSGVSQPLAQSQQNTDAAAAASSPQIQQQSINQNQQNAATNSQDQMSHIKPLDLGEGNTVIGITLQEGDPCDGAYRIDAKNSQGQSRNIFVHPDGKITNFQNETTISGFVAQTLQQNVKKLFEYFKVKYPEPKLDKIAKIIEEKLDNIKNYQRGQWEGIGNTGYEIGVSNSTGQTGIADGNYLITKEQGKLIVRNKQNNYEKVNDFNRDIILFKVANAVNKAHEKGNEENVQPLPKP